jgi:hypothetical protein
MHAITSSWTHAERKKVMKVAFVLDMLKAEIEEW